MSLIPEKLVAYNLYNEGELLIGSEAEVELPSFEAVTAEIAGPGILGTIESPNVGHFGALTVSITFRTVSKDSAKLNTPPAHTLTLRADQNSYDTGAGEIRNRGLKVVLRGRTKKYEAGKMKAGETTGTKVEIGLEYIKIEEDGNVLLELDKYNYIYVVNGADYLAEVRKNI